MVWLFWSVSGLFAVVALSPVLGGLPFGRAKAWISVFFLMGCYGTYHFWGGSDGLRLYYRSDQIQKRTRQASLRPLLAEFHKTEQRYLLRVERDPSDREAWLNLGQIYLIQQNQEEAERAFARARSLSAIAEGEKTSSSASSVSSKSASLTSPSESE